MTQAMTLRPNQPLAQSEWQVLREQAQFLVKSGFLPSSIRTSEQAVAIILLGRELHIEPWAALSTINVIQGKPTVSPQLMLALIERSGQAEQIDIQGDAAACTVTMQRRGRAPYTETFTMDDAKRISTKEDGKMIPLAEKYNWRSMPKVMLRWRAVAACARVVFPDVILGLFTAEEMGADVAFTDTGEVVVADNPERLITYHAPAELPERVDLDTGEVPFDDDAIDLDDSETPALDPHRVVAYNQLIRRALMANNAAAQDGRPEPFDLAEWELSSGTTLEDLNSQGRRLKARLQELEAVSV